jgi:hypothetical protein
MIRDHHDDDESSMTADDDLSLCLSISTLYPLRLLLGRGGDS